MSRVPAIPLMQQAAAMLATWLLAACASTGGLAPDVARLDADTLDARRSLSATQETFPAHDWWQAFADPQLDALMQEALRDEPSLAIADARLRAARAQAGLAQADRGPTVAGNVRYSGTQLPQTMLPEGGGRLRGTGVVTLDLAWSPDLWGVRRAQWEAAVGELRARKADAQAARLAVSSALAREYLALADALATHDVAEREHARARHVLALTDQRVKAGLDNDLQWHAAQTAIGLAQQQLQASAQRIKAQQFALAALLGKGPDRGLDLLPPQVLQTPVAAVPARLPSSLLGQRPDVVAARWRVEAAARGVDAVTASFRPSINLSALAGVVAPTLSDLFRDDAVFTLSGPALNLPIFDAGRRRARLAGRYAELDLSQAHYNHILVLALQQVVDALHAAHSLSAQQASVEDALNAAQRAFALALARYEGGLGTQLDVLAAQRPLLELEQQQHSLRTRRLIASVNLIQALGGGLPPDAPETDALPNLSSP